MGNNPPKISCKVLHCIFMVCCVLWLDWKVYKRYLFFGYKALWFIQRMPIPCILKEPLNVFCECWIVFKNAHSQWFFKQNYLCCALFHCHFIGIHSVVLGRRSIKVENIHYHRHTNTVSNCPLRAVSFLCSTKSSIHSIHCQVHSWRKLGAFFRFKKNNVDFTFLSSALILNSKPITLFAMSLQFIKNAMNSSLPSIWFRNIMKQNPFLIT